jgi:hypothetical protein
LSTYDWYYFGEVDKGRVVKGEEMTTKAKPVNENYVRMYYEHQYESVAKLEDAKLTITNYVLTISALIFTFGYQGSAQLTLINGVGLPLMIIIANLFPVIYIDRSSKFIETHKERAHEILKLYAPELKELHDNIGWPKGGFLSSHSEVQQGIHLLLIFIALIPMLLYLYQLYG